MFGRTEHNIPLTRLTKIPMPFKDDDPRKSLRPRKDVCGTPENGAPPKRTAIGSFFMSPSPSICIFTFLHVPGWLKMGLKTRRHETRGWLKNTLQHERLLADDKDSVWTRVMSDYRCQLSAVDGMRDVMGDTFVDPRDHAGVVGADSGGKFVSMKKESQRNVPKNPYTLPYLLHAYDVSRTTFQRYRKMGETTHLTKPKRKTNANLGLNVIDDLNFAKQRFTARFFFVQGACRTRETPEGVVGQAKVAYWGEKFDKMKWDKEGEDIEKWERMVREHLAQQPFIKEALVEALESNCCRSYTNLHKVPPPTPFLHES